MLQVIHTIWRITKGPTLVKRLTDAQCASIPAFKLVTWKITWWGSIQEKSQTSAISATTLAHLLVSCKATWRPTLGKSLSIATYAAKLTVLKAGWTHIWKFIWPRCDCLADLEKKCPTWMTADNLYPVQTQQRPFASYATLVFFANWMTIQKKTFCWIWIIYLFHIFCVEFEIYLWFQYFAQSNSKISIGQLDAVKWPKNIGIKVLCVKMIFSTAGALIGLTV